MENKCAIDVFDAWQRATDERGSEARRRSARFEMRDRREGKGESEEVYMERRRDVKECEVALMGDVRRVSSFSAHGT